MTNINISTLVQWSTPKRVNTRNGPRMLRTATPTEAFWTAWRNGKDTLKSAGVSCAKDRGGNWEAAWWLPVNETEQTAATQAVAESRATTGNGEMPAPTGLAYLPYQKAGIQYASARPATLIADEMGLGKTIQAIGVFNADPTINKVLVLCPATLRLNWQREFEKWAVRPVRVVVVNGGKSSDWPQEAYYNVVIVNYDVAAKHRKVIDAYNWDLLVADEAHRLKNPKALRTQAVLGKVAKGKRIAEGIKAKRKLFLTGTPIVNRPVELWPLVEALDPTDMGRSFFGFAKRYCGAKQTRFGWDFTGASNLPELQNRLRERFMIRRLKADVLPELPAKRRQVVEIPANGAAGAVAEEKRIFAKHEDYIAKLEQELYEAEIQAAADMATDDMVFGIRSRLNKARSVAFTEMSKARHEVALAKVPHVIEHLEDALEEGPVVCAVYHKDVAAKLQEAFADRCVVLTGDTPMAARQQAVDDFQAGRKDLFIGNILAAGVGITLTRSSHVVFAELDWVPGNLSQFEDRCHRIGQTNSVLVQHLVLQDSLDAMLIRKIIAKQEVIAEAMDTQTEINWGGAAITEEVKIDIKPDRIAEAAAKITDAQIAAAHHGLRILAGMCDGACARDNVGFNKMDSRIGKEPAARSSLTKRQAAIAVKFAVKYHRQLPEALVSAAKGS